MEFRVQDLIPALTGDAAARQRVTGTLDTVQTAAQQIASSFGLKVGPLGGSAAPAVNKPVASAPAPSLVSQVFSGPMIVGALALAGVVYMVFRRKG